MSLVSFLTKNKKFFDSHNLHDLHSKFTKRLGVLENCQHIKGVTAVLDKWKDIYVNSEEYVCDLLSESPPEMMVPLLKRINKGVTYKHIISKKFVEPKGRDKSLEKMHYYNFIDEGQIQRRVHNNVTIILIINEKESAVIFSTSNNEPDLRNMFYGAGSGFHDWCLDYFEYMWKKSKNMPNVKPGP